MAISRSFPAHYPLLIMVSRSLCLCLASTSIRIRSHHRVLVMSHYTIASCFGARTAGDAVGISAIFVACATFIQAAKLSSGYQRTKTARSPLLDWCVMWTLIGSMSVARSSSRRGRRGRLGFNHSLWTLLVQLPTCCRLRKTLWRLDQTDSNLNKVYSARSMWVQQEVKGV